MESEDSCSNCGVSLQNADEDIVISAQELHEIKCRYETERVRFHHEIERLQKVIRKLRKKDTLKYMIQMIGIDNGPMSFKPPHPSLKLVSTAKAQVMGYVYVTWEGSETVVDKAMELLSGNTKEVR